MSDNALAAIGIVAALIFFVLLVEANTGALSDIIRSFRGKK